MKTKKILAIVTLVAFMVSILPMAAFAVATPYNTYGSVVSVEEATAPAIKTSGLTQDEINKADGLEYEVTLVSQGDLTGNLFVATNRAGTDVIYYNDGDSWEVIPAGGIDATTLLATSTDKVVSIDIKIISSIAGNIKVAFGNDGGAVENYVTGKAFDNDASPSQSIANIIGQKLYDGTFTAPTAKEVTLTALTLEDKAANGVSAHEVEAYVESAAGYPVSGVEVEFSISGSGATLSASKVKTGVNGKAKVKITATKPGTYEVTAEAGDGEDDIDVVFKSTGIVDIAAKSDNNQKVASEQGDKKFEYNLYDAAGNKVTPTTADVLEMELDILSEPSKSDLSTGFNAEVKDVVLKVIDGVLTLVVDTDELIDGDYQIRVSLLNGKQVTYSFSAKEQGDVVSMELDYDASSYAAESTVPSPTLKYADAEGYTTEKDPTSKVKFSVSDATFIDTWYTNGSFKLEDKLGSFIVTAVDTDESLVATFEISVGKAASSLKLTAPSYTPVGEDATVKIQLVDADGKPVAPGVVASDSDAFVLSKPTGAIVGDLEVDVDDFADGEASVDVTSNVAGNVVIQVVIEADGKAYTGSATVAFGEAAAARKSLIMFIGSNNYMVGNQPAITDAAPFIKDGRTYVAVRPIGDALGSTIYWDAATQTVTLVKPGETVTIVIGSSVIKVDRAGVVTEYPTDAPAHIKDGRTYLPFRAIGEAMGYTVTWDAATQAVIFS